MREAAFIKKNKERWIEFENMLKEPNSLPPDKAAYCYLQVINDLSYAQTYYPRTETTQYLNQIAQRAHFSIYRNKKEKSSRIITFWKTELPTIFAQYQKDLLLSVVLFFLFALIGLFSVRQDVDFARMVLGDGYVDMTVQNIKKGDPAAVYHGQSPFLMFVMIAANNIAVGFKCFILGIFGTLGTLYMLFFNGIMLGSFTGFFMHYGVGVEANSIIWIHGVIEIFVITVCGAAGLILGKSLLFPQTYTRLQSVRKGFWDGTKICFSTLPFFLTAAFLESCVTRHTKMPLAAALLIIGASLCLIVFYYIILPKKLTKKSEKPTMAYL
ncbi:MAG: stage II sporulation protein M [Prevotellaceae bacterium]|jgi:uncharacterized membrane protein SpoIIM required for sporulation|nr:stage II sporulation protein M [Prevotellaceae bacterium]